MGGKLDCATTTRATGTKTSKAARAPAAATFQGGLQVAVGWTTGFAKSRSVGAGMVAPGGARSPESSTSSTIKVVRALTAAGPSAIAEIRAAALAAAGPTGGSGAY